MNIVHKAKLFATAAHAAVGQKRKYTGEPYIVHPAEVVDIIKSSGVYLTHRQMAAAWLHDVVEDTGVSLELIEQEFGVYVAMLVEQLTDISKPEDGNRAARKEIDRQHTAKCCPAAATIKLADLISNTQSITWWDPEFAKVYIPEKLKLLEVLKDKGADPLYEIALNICTQYVQLQKLENA